jgi:lipopolysaccharide export system protein LptA
MTRLTAMRRFLLPLCLLLVLCIGGQPALYAYAQDDEGETNVAEGDPGAADPNTADAPVRDADADAAEADDTAVGEAETAEAETDSEDTAEQTTEDADAAPAEEENMFDRDEMLRNLPGIARDQPGFIPDQDPEDLFHRPDGRTPRERYKTLLGETDLPAGSVRDIIGIQTGDPSRDTPENFARIVVPDGTIEGSTESKQFRIRGGVIIFYGDVEITAESADIDEKNEMAVLRESVEIVDPNYTLKTNELRIFFKDKRFEALGFVQFQKNAKPNAGKPDMSLPKKDRLREHFSAQQFELYGNKLYYDWGNKTMTALQAVRLVHPSFNGTMERLDYNDKSKSYAMNGDVVLDISEYDWIFTNQLVDAADEKKVRAVTDVPTKITSDKVLYSDETAIAQFYANVGEQVNFDQTKRKITASYMEINDTTKDFFAEGIEGAPATFNQTNGEWLFDAEIISRQGASEELRTSLSKPLTASANTITYNYDRKRLEMDGGVAITGEGQSITAGHMVQDETAKFFLVRDNVIIQPDAQTRVNAAQVYVDTANDVYTFVGLVEGGFTSPELATALGPVAGTGEPGDADASAQPGVFQSQGTGTDTGGSGTITSR